MSYKLTNCGIEYMEMTDQEIKKWCALGCSTCCFKLLKKKYKLKNKQMFLFVKVKED